VDLGDRLFVEFQYSFFDNTEDAYYVLTDGTPDGTGLYTVSDGFTFLLDPVPFGSDLLIAAERGRTFETYLLERNTGSLVALQDTIKGLPTGQLRHFAALEDQVYFSRRDTAAGLQLWRVDTASRAAAKVVDLAPATEPVGVRDLQLFEDVYFAQLYYSDRRQVSLLRTDGTASGTYTLLDSISAKSRDGLSLGEVVSTDGEYYFLADRPAGKGTELWATDGTVAGTRLVKDIYPGADDPDIDQLTALGATVLFVGDSPEYGRELFRSDGTTAGTGVVTDINTSEASSSPHRLFVLNDTLYFNAVTNCTGIEVFKTGGSATSTGLLGDFSPGRESSIVSDFVSIGDDSYFIVRGEGLSMPKVFRSGGTLRAPVEITDSIDILSKQGSLSGPGAANGKLLINGYFYGTGQVLYAYDPASGTTTLLKVFSQSGSNSIFSSYVPFDDNTLLFVQATDANGAELWRTDGTPEGTYLIKDIRQIDETTSYYHISDLAVINGLAYFSADRGDGSRPYRSDGTQEGTYELQGAGTLARPRDFTAYAGRVYFTAGEYDDRLYSTGGQPYDVTGSTITDGFSGFTYINDLTVLGDRLVFVAATEAAGSELWAASDPDSPAVLLGDLYAGPANSYPRDLTVFGDLVYFSADLPELGRELWATDGTPAGTVLVSDLNAGTKSGEVENMIVYNDFLYFSADDGIRGRELWKYSPTDLDNDGYTGTDDADETDPAINAGTHGDPDAVTISCPATEEPSTADHGNTVELSVRVYPNPTAHTVYVDTPGRGTQVQRWQLYSSTGRQLSAGSLSAISQSGITVGHLPAGHYLLRLADDRGRGLATFPISVVR
jgi:ELWxxDGT repeat protein